MHKLIEWVIAHLPLDLRILYRQFLLRVIDLEALSIQADIPRFLGQFAGVLMMLSMVHTVGFYVSLTITRSPAEFLAVSWYFEHYFIATMMLVVGLFTVIAWDSTFPDRRDAMILAPLPIASRTILFAKIASSCSIWFLAIVTLNFASGSVLTLLVGYAHSGFFGFLRCLAAYWFTMVAASGFVYGSVLTVQGFTALLLPRRLFLRLSAILQLFAFGLFLGVYFLQPSLSSPPVLAEPGNQWIFASSPSFWFFALFNQLNGTLPPALSWLAYRAWIGLAVVFVGSLASLLLCYIHTMQKTIEQPDLVPGARGFHWAPRLGSSLTTAIGYFTIRSLIRSRQHRVAYAFYLAIVFAIALSVARGTLAAPAPGPVTREFLISTFMMMLFAVVGLSRVFSLPISLTANWVLRIAQPRPTEKYFAATRHSSLLIAVLPWWVVSAILSFSFRPAHQVVVHLVVLAVLGSILADLSLIGFSKVPFTCSFLPGKSNIQYVFWFFAIAVIPIVASAANYELHALNHPRELFRLGIGLGAVAWGLWALNRHRAKSAVLYYEELPEEVITTLGLIPPRAWVGQGEGYTDIKRES
jgi:hypothetical protein